MASRCALLLDFDNIFFGLWRQDEALALDFGNRPKEWLPILAQSYLTSDNRRWLVAKCYLNPNGWVSRSGHASDRIQFFRFRAGLIGAGFEVIDCPSMTGAGKNAADIRIVIDALDLLYHRSDYEEFVVASGDSDFTPLLQRIRADNRLITVISPGIMSPAYSSLADKLIDFTALEAIVRPKAEPENPMPEVEPTVAYVAERTVFANFIRTRYSEAPSALSLPALAHEVAKAAPDALASGWFGLGFVPAIAELSLPSARLEQNFLWDEERHQPPGLEQSHVARTMPETIESVFHLLEVPRLRTEAWPVLFETLGRYAADHEFNLTEATRWSRDQLASTAMPIARPAFSYAVKGAQFGGAPLNSDPPPNAEEIARAFCNSLIDRAYQAGMVLDAQDVIEISNWFGVKPDPDEQMPLQSRES